ncbi:MAG: rod shape-determining protein MreD [Prevotella sp.]|nr:rod shape-determining protein MreD [Prevotella sp.]MBQ9222219.1 rod shape-determining protein MreD [Prevotella sp.]MBR0524353.1 rod shape-determining protein MreD [Prevotella sp.]
MATDILKKTILLIVFCLVQVLVCNQIHLFGYATPLIYVYFVILFQRNYPKWAILLWSFALGLLIDVFSNIPGVAAGAMTFLAFLQPYILKPFIPRDSIDDLKPSFANLGIMKFSGYTLICVVIYCLTFFSLEAFSFFNWQQWLSNIGASAALTFLIILIIENVRYRQ